MAFENLPPSKAAVRRPKKETILGVGWHAFVNWPHSGDPVPLLDSGGALLANDLADGQEVEILSWRPRSREGLAYQIRRLADNRECWILATHLRRQRRVEPTADDAAAALPLAERR